MITRILLYGALLLCTAFIACSDSTVTPPSGPQNADQLLPLAVGNVWVYKEKSKFGTVDNRFVIASLRSLPFTSTTGEGTRDFFVDSTSFFGYGNDTNGVTVGNLKVNGSVTSVFVVGKIPKVPTAGYVNGQYKYIGTGSVTVPAGTFAECHVFEFSQLGQKQTEYYSKGVGIVKIVGIDAAKDTVLTRDLLSYSLK
jgi:hypothetical protein